MRHLTPSLPLALGLALISQAGWVAAAPCKPSDVTAAAYVETPSVAPNLQYSAACVGSHAGNDTPLPTLNLGYRGDGLLNGAPQSTPPYASPFPGGAFVGESDYSDLNGDGFKDDPGWIMLGRMNFSDDGMPGAFVPSAIGGQLGIVLDDFFSVTPTGTGTGTWRFTPDDGFTERAETLLGKHYFDQLALIFKASNAFAVYDFTAAQFDLEAGGLFALEGKYDTTGTLLTPNGKRAAGISHISLWARDPEPVAVETVPEPSTLAMLGLAFAALGFTRLRPKA